MLVLLYAVAVSAAILPCKELCKCPTSVRFPSHRPECECLYKEVGLPMDTAIYYEPADYISPPTLIYDRPFYIINPYVARRKIDSISSDNSGLNMSPYSSRFVPNTGIEVNIETDLTREIKGKNIQIETIRRSPIYLDINIEPEDKSTIEILNAEGLQLTEPDLLECADLYISLEFKKSYKKNPLSTEYPSQLQQYEHLSNNELINIINDKCSYILQIVEKSQKEIKETRPKKTYNKLLQLNDQENNEQQVDGDLMQPNTNDNYRNNETNVILPAVSGKANINEIEKGDENQVGDENTADTTEDIILSSETPFTTGASSLDEDLYTSLSQISTIEDIEDTPETMNIQESRIEMDADTKYSTPHDEIIASVNNIEQDESHRSIEDELIVKEIEENNSSRPHYEENEIQLVKVITQEFNNDTVQSFINGTEDLPNGDFDDEFHSTEDKTSDDVTPLPAESKADAPRVLHGIRDQSLNITGKIYFLFNENYIPARFVQKSNGTLHLGIEGASLCNLLNKEEPKSMLLTTLCNCYKNDNCASRD